MVCPFDSAYCPANASGGQGDITTGVGRLSPNARMVARRARRCLAVIGTLSLVSAFFAVPAAAASPSRPARRVEHARSADCTVPSAPGSVSAAAGANQATVSWSTATGGPVTAYVVREVTGAEVGESIATDATATSGSLTGLSGGTAATFSVVAESSCGTGPASTSAPVTPSGSAPTYVGSVLAHTPSAFYRLDETSGTVLADSSGAEADGTYSGQETLDQPPPLATDPAPSAGYTNCCAGIATAQPALPQGNAARTVDAWFETGNGTFNQTLVEWGSGGTDTAWIVSIDGQALNVDASNDYVSFPTPRAINDGNWHQVAVTYNGTSVVAYLDGQLLGRSTFSGTLNTLGTSMTLASDPIGGYNQFSGDLADVAIFPAALTTAQVSSLFTASGYGRPTAPMDVYAAYGGDNAAQISWGYATAHNTAVTAYLVTAVHAGKHAQSVAVPADATAAQLTGLAAGNYTFDVQALDAYGSGPGAVTSSLTVGGSASTYASTVLAQHPSVFYRLADTTTTATADSSGNGATGSYLADNVTLNQPPPLASDPAPSVAANGGVIASAYPTLPLHADPRTVEAWVNTTSDNFQYLAGYGSPSTDEAFALGIEPSGSNNQVYLDAYNETLTFTSPTALDDGNWHLVAVTTDGTNATAYVDGTSLGTQQLQATLNTLPYPSGLIVGGTTWNSSQGVRGDLADVAVFPNALTATQLRAQFAASGYSAPPAPGTPQATAGTNRATVTWTAPAGADPAITAYLVTALAGGTVKGVAVAVPAGTTKAVVTGLAGRTNYTFEVQAINAYGAGATATTGSVTPRGAATTYASTVQADGPTVFYRLADSTTAAMADSSGNGATGSYDPSDVTLGQPAALASDPAPSIATTWTAGSGYPSGLPAHSAPRTLEAWLNTTNNNFGALAGYGTASTSEGFALSVHPDNQANAVYVDAYSDTLTFPSPVALDDGSWHLVAVTTDGTSATVYIDGTAIGTKSFAAPLDTIPSAAGLVVGGDPWGQGFDGELADVALFPTALSATAMRAQFTASGYRKPAAPGSPAASAGANQATVTWTAVPATDPPVTAYLVTALAGGTTPANAISADATSTTATLTGLAGGTSYTFQIQAVNAYGAGTAATTASVTPSGPASTYATTVLADNPAAFYRLADESPAVMADSSGSGATGGYYPSAVTLGQPPALASDPAPSAAVTGTAGTGYPKLPLYSAPRTLEGWVNTTNNGFGYVAAYGTQANAQAFGLAVGPNEVYAAGYNDDLSFASPTTLDDGSWHFVAITTTGTAATAYVDGRRIGTRTFGTALDTLDAGTGLFVAGAPWGQGYSGELADVALFPGALTAAQVQNQFAASGYSTPAAPSAPVANAGANQATVSWTAAPAGDPAITGYLVTAITGGNPANAVSVPASATTATLTGLAGGTSYSFRIQAVNEYGAGAQATTSPVTPSGSATTDASTVLANGPSVFYRLADTATAAMADSSGGANTGQYIPSAVTLGQPGPFSDDPATSAAATWTIGQSFPSLPLYAHPRTLEGWVKTTSGGFGFLAGYGSQSNTEAFAVGVGPDEVYVAGYNDDLTFTPTVSLDDGNWHFVAVTTNGTTATAYVDGTSLGTQPFGTPLDTLPATSGFLVGGAPWGQGYSGDLADVAVFPRALTASQVAAQFAASSAARQEGRG